MAEEPVAAFFLDITPVTNAAYLSFVTSDPRWQKGRAAKLFVDDRYLAQWHSPLSPGAALDLQAPVVGVSWFAARAFCNARNGARLPTTDEWELAAQASTTEVDASTDPAFTKAILGWYSQQAPARLPAVGGGDENIWGVKDLHGLVWEWVEDFSAALVSTDNRASGEKQDIVQFCGGGAQSAVNPSDYASFMRFAFRSALEARFATNNLGFRCAHDVVVGTPFKSAGVAP